MKMSLKVQAFLDQDCAEMLQQKSLHQLEKLKNKAIYIAGGTGFVGSWVATLLTYLNTHHNFNTKIFLLARNPDKLNQTAPHLTGNKNISLIANDVRNIFELPADVSYVIHAACNPDSRTHALNPLETASIIVDGTRNLLNTTRSCSHLENFLFLSSAGIYGNQPHDLQNLPEDFLASSPRCNSIAANYAEAKRFAETLCAIYRSQYRLPMVTARPFSFIGPFQALDKPWAINNFIQDVLAERPIKILGDGKTIRSYLYGSDVAYWLLTMLTHRQEGEVYNLGSDHAISLVDLASWVPEIAGVKTKVLISDQRMSHLQKSRLIPDLHAVKKDLNLSVMVALQVAIEKTLTWSRLCK
jgi:nucleoside-diphosphate-sugar epimerase